MERIAFRMRLRPGRDEEYRRRHTAVWPELLADLKAAGAWNYSIYLDGQDLFGYLEVDDFARFRTTMATSEPNSHWQLEMDELIDPMVDPETGFHRRLEEVFHLD